MRRGCFLTPKKEKHVVQMLEVQASGSLGNSHNLGKNGFVTEAMNPDEPQRNPVRFTHS